MDHLSGVNRKIYTAYNETISNHYTKGKEIIMDATKVASKVFVGILAVSFGAAIMKSGLKQFAEVILPVIDQIEVKKK